MSREVFENLKKLKELFMNDNKIEIVPDNVFGGLTSLEKLALGRF